jgi:hypothetical protein
MGLEAECTARLLGKASSKGRARFEETEIVFRGDFRAVVPIAAVKTLDVRGGTLVLQYPSGPLELDLGAAKAKSWAARILQPRGLAEKLGLKPGLRVALDLDEPALLREAEEEGAEVVGPRARDLDLVFVSLETKKDLPRLAKAKARIKKNGAVWAVWPKGRKELREDDIRAFNTESGLVDVKVVRVSDRLSGLKLVIPKKDR